jgi:hypothetical protein
VGASACSRSQSIVATRIASPSVAGSAIVASGFGRTRPTVRSWRAAQCPAGQPLHQDGGQVHGGLGLDLGLTPGVGATGVAGLALPKQRQHLDQSRDAGGLAGGVADGEFPPRGLVAQVADDSTESAARVVSISVTLHGFL